jgi:mono/diheme cytochrome c family protein
MKPTPGASPGPHREGPASRRLSPLLLLLAAASCGPRGAAPAPAGTGSAAVTASASALAAGGSGCAARAPGRLVRAAAPGASGAVELVRAGARTFALVADTDERALHTVDVETLREVAVTPLPGRPGHVLALADGRVAVTLRDAGRVVVLEAADEALQGPLLERCSAAVGGEPWALAEAGDRLLVTSAFGATLTVLGAGDLRATHTLPLPREPRALILANHSTTAFVTHAVGGVVSAIDLTDLSLPPAVLGLRAGRRLMKGGELDDKRPREASQGYALASVTGPRASGEDDTLRVFAPHASVDPGAPEGGASSGYGGPGVRPVAPLVSVLDPVARRSITNHVASAFDGPFASDCLLPRGAAADAGGLFVACLDLDAVLELDPWVGDPILAERRRFALPAGPSAVVLAAGGQRLFAWSELDRALSRIEREGGAVTSTVLWRRAGEPRDPLVERGRRLFHTSRDARVAQGRACASCHPEGRDDGLVWTSPDGARQTPMLAGRLQGTAPYGWYGESATVREHVNRTFARLGGTGFDAPAAAADFDALLAYATSLPSPPATPAADAEAAARGQQVFRAYCNDCHKEGGTDGQVHDVGSGVAGERRAAFDTPSLRGVRGTAPYFHDGRYATLADVLAAKDQRMYIGTLTDAEQRDLLGYLETL